MEQAKRIKKYIDKFQNIHLFGSPELYGDSLAAGLALYYSLKQTGKNATLINQGLPQEYEVLMEKEKHHPNQADFLISIKEAGAKLSQLFYEKTTDGLNLFLKTDGGELKQENIFFQPLYNEMLLITIGVQSLREIRNVLAGKKYSILNIDNSPDNEEYGQANLIEPNYASLSEMAFDLACQISENKPLSNQVASALWSGIVKKATNTANFRFNKESWRKIRFLRELGTDIAFLANNVFPGISQANERLFSQLLSATEIAEKNSLAWAFLTKTNFDNLEAAPNNLIFSFNKIQQGFFPVENFVCLWEQNNSPLLIRGVFYSQNRERTDKLASFFQGQRKGNGLLFTAKENSLKEAGDNIVNMINNL